MSAEVIRLTDRKRVEQPAGPERRAALLAGALAWLLWARLVLPGPGGRGGPWSTGAGRR